MAESPKRTMTISLEAKQGKKFFDRFQKKYNMRSETKGPMIPGRRIPVTVDVRRGKMQQLWKDLSLTETGTVPISKFRKALLRIANFLRND